MQCLDNNLSVLSPPLLKIRELVADLLILAVTAYFIITESKMLHEALESDDF